MGNPRNRKRKKKRVGHVSRGKKVQWVLRTAQNSQNYPKPELKKEVSR